MRLSGAVRQRQTKSVLSGRLFRYPVDVIEVAVTLIIIAIEGETIKTLSCGAERPAGHRQTSRFRELELVCRVSAVISRREERRNLESLAAAGGTRTIAGGESQQAAVITTAATDHPRQGEKVWGNARTECSEGGMR